MKAVLISIQPKWCELIARGEKTVEVRKTRPKLKTPFKVYIYCTMPKNKHDNLVLTQFGYDVGSKGAYCNYVGNSNGKVIGEFVCNRINYIGWLSTPASLGWKNRYNEDSCLTDSQLYDYSDGGCYYEWRISNLVIYDQPKELSEFKTICRNAYCQNDWGKPTWFCKDGYSSCAVVDKEKEYPYNEECIYFDCPSVGGESCEYEDYAYCNCDGLKPITRPPQSWCYVEE